MSTLTYASSLQLNPAPAASSAAPEQPIGDQLNPVIRSIYELPKGAERREEVRHHYPQLIYLSPLPEDEPDASCRPFVGVGRSLSKSGVGFYSNLALPYQQMIVSLQSSGGWLGFIVKLRWCRYIRYGWYDNGGQFIESIPSPMET